MPGLSTDSLLEVSIRAIRVPLAVNQTMPVRARWLAPSALYDATEV